MKIKIDQNFKYWTIVKYTEEDNWLCRCVCGSEAKIPESWLLSGFSTSCGCKWSRAKDLRGKRFGLLIAIEPVAEKAKDGSIKWKCKCDCGGETIVSSNKLLQNHTTSCGCKGIAEARNAKTYVDGTCLELLFSSKLRKNNTSGHTGVSMKRGRWIAYINVSKKKYSLGSFDTLEEAAKARKNAEIYWKKRLIGEE